MQWWRVSMAALAGVLLALALPACDPRSAQVTAAHAIALAGQRLSPALRAVEQDQGLDVIDAAVDRGADEPAIRAALDQLEARWAPTWAALVVLRESIAAWLVAIEADSTGDWGALLGAACRVLVVAKPLAPAELGALAGLVRGVCP